MGDIILRDICKSYGEHPVLTHFSAVFPAGKVSCITGPSGKGKTTLLRLLMGLETPDSGSIEGISGQRVSVVFQESRLCDNLSAPANIRLVSPDRQRSEIVKAMQEVGLVGCADQPVREFSGGMRRRVAILRALLAEYDLLLLDEPFKGLDSETKGLVMADTVRRTHGKTVIFVTHAPEEAEILGACQQVAL